MRPSRSLRRLAAIGLLAVVGRSAPAASVGSVSFQDGEVSVVRDGEVRDDLAIGFRLENFDLVQTGADGTAELALGGSGVPTVSITVAPGTQFAIEIARLGSRQQTSIGLLAGTVSLKCAKLAAGQDLKVRTDTTVMGVRGTRFTVTAPASGDLLVTCDEGEVDCTDEEGATSRAVPGTVVEKRAGERLRGLAVSAASLEQYRQGWLAERVAALTAGALPAIIILAGLHDALSRQFADDFAALMTAQKILDQWADEHRRGTLGGVFERARQRREIIAALLRIRRTLSRLERVHARLVLLKAYHDGGVGRGEMGAGLSTERFFQRFDLGRGDLERKMAQVRFAAKLYALRSGGRVPSGAFDETEEETAFR